MSAMPAGMRSTSEASKKDVFSSAPVATRQVSRSPMVARLGVTDFASTAPATSTVEVAVVE